MDKPIVFIAQMMVPYLFIAGLGFLGVQGLLPEDAERCRFRTPHIAEPLGNSSFIKGMATISNHFRWGYHLEIIVRLIGLSFLLKRAFLILMPEIPITSIQTTRKMLSLVGTGFSLMVFILAGYHSYD